MKLRLTTLTNEEKVDRLMEKVEKQKLDGHFVHDCGRRGPVETAER